MSFAKRFDQSQTRKALAKMAFLVAGIKRGTLKVESFGFWKGVTDGRYTFRIVIVNINESEEILNS